MAMTHSLMAAAEVSSTWFMGLNPLTMIKTDSQATGSYAAGDGSLMGSFEETNEGLVLKGWWQESSSIQSCGPDNAWSGSFIFLFAADGRSFIGDKGDCSITSDNLNVQNRTWEGSLMEGMVFENPYPGIADGTSCEASVAANLDIHIPVASFQTTDETSNIWADLEYKGIDSDGEHVWRLKNYGNNQ